MTLADIRQALLTAAVLAATSCLLHAQGTFQNLNFEQALVPDVLAGQYGGDVLVTNGAPHWAVYLGGTQQSSMFHNNLSLGGPAVSIFGPQWISSQILEGNYTISLQPSTAGPPLTAAIGQTGSIPLTAKSVRFYGQANGGYAVTFGGQPIPLITIGSTSSYSIFGGDISAFANQTGELRFQGVGLLDAVQFSTVAIPEPGVFGLSALGALLLGWRVLRRR